MIYTWAVRESVLNVYAYNVSRPKTEAANSAHGRRRRCRRRSPVKDRTKIRSHDSSATTSPLHGWVQARRGGQRELSIIQKPIHPPASCSRLQWRFAG